ncbi:RdgB/HAM1 family non-canonical purine NTP pyrophosphatase [Microcella sp.]|uniref:RdgB/HAM1 family non-canonical purine NTP pyrophosphatase n=1 Tax=Microcella sp. TaxID=1913979 RepID=UPI00299F7DE0|nr:RdgB/HAM1 family non-canonical purine NTP pyrophosphatase [Microcella sp.]MDX2025533.1 RdgB/HAM1 family non-canonical purine NTP pyrophosphatase [Microcella sp.]
MRVVVATHNAHKVAELQRILGAALPSLELLPYDGPAPDEDGGTFAENALIKARAAAAHTGLPAIADDSGVSVDALAGAPGVDSAHYSGERDDTANLRLVLSNLGDESNRAAQFTCAAALVDPLEVDENGVAFEHVELGVWPGTIALEAAGVGGFGYDPIFIPEGLTVTSAEISADEKNAISHRGRAFAALARVLAERYGAQ